jgi:RNA polymerase-interacting CarD/CdnL/TRCF family regulator
MTTIAIRKKLVDYMQVAEDKKVKAVYALLEDDMKQGNRISINQYNKEIEAAMEEIKSGDVYSHEEVVKLSKKW